MNYYVAPMEGLTDLVWRQAHQKWFGWAGGPARYYAPFLSPPENRVLIKKKMAELAPEANPGVPVIPQLLAKDGELAAWMIGELRKLGYTEVNLNFGCPAGTVTAKGKGSGMLRDPAKLDAFLEAVFSHAEGPISVKTRLGVEKPEEFAAILTIYNRYPISELTIHPRVMRQLYRGQADREAFAAALPQCKLPVCYNGDITTTGQRSSSCHTLQLDCKMSKFMICCHCCNAARRCVSNAGGCPLLAPRCRVKAFSFVICAPPEA